MPRSASTTASTAVFAARFSAETILDGEVLRSSKNLDSPADGVSRGLLWPRRSLLQRHVESPARRPLQSARLGRHLIRRRVCVALVVGCFPRGAMPKGTPLRHKSMSSRCSPAIRSSWRRSAAGCRAFRGSCAASASRSRGGPTGKTAAPAAFGKAATSAAAGRGGRPRVQRLRRPQPHPRRHRRDSRTERVHLGPQPDPCRTAATQPRRGEREQSTTRGAPPRGEKQSERFCKETRPPSGRLAQPGGSRGGTRCRRGSRERHRPRSFRPRH